MTLSSGTKLGPYEILAPIGAGGMGEVYRAKDPRLGREVAIKVLPASFSQDADRLKRFEQEARAAGVLNHPNITAVYDFGMHDGAPYIVTELLEGETLRSRLGPGRDLAAQGDRLRDADREGARRGAREGDRASRSEAREHLSDEGRAGQDPGLRPRQAEARRRRERPDRMRERSRAGRSPGSCSGRWATCRPSRCGASRPTNGAISSPSARSSTRCSSGQRAFRGDTAADTITAILTKEPPDLSQTNKDIHPGLDRIVRHCLEKNPEERFESARDVAFDLEALSGVTTPSAATRAVESAPRRRRLPLLLGAAVVLIGVAAGAYVAGKRAGHVAPASFRQLTFRRGLVGSARFAPDGQTILYSASWDGRPIEIFQTRLDSPESRPFGLAGAELLSISRSGEMAVSLNRHDSIPFTRAGTLARLGMTGGGSPKEVLEDVQFADWSPDGQSLAVVRNLGGKVRLEFPPGKVLYETAGWISNPRVSPGGDEVAFLDHPVQGDDGGSAAMVDRSGKRRSLSEFFASAPGALLVAGRQGSLVHRRDRRIQPRTLRRDARRRRACAGPGDRRSHRRGLFEGRPSADGPGQGAAGHLGSGSRGGEGAGLFVAGLVPHPGSLAGRADPAFYGERRRRRARLLRPTSARPMARPPCVSVPETLSVSPRTRGSRSPSWGKPRIRGSSSIQSERVSQRPFPPTASECLRRPGFPTAAESCSRAASPVVASASGCRASGTQSPARSLPRAIGCWRRPSPRTESSRRSPGRISATTSTRWKGASQPRFPDWSQGTFLFRGRPTADRSWCAGAEKFPLGSCCSTLPRARRSSGRSSFPRTLRESLPSVRSSSRPTGSSTPIPTPETSRTSTWWRGSSR